MPSSSETLRAAVRWFFEDRSTGRIVIAQKLNLALWILFGAAIAKVALKPLRGWGRAIEIVELAALAAWALDEIFRGVNPWRRMLGAFTLIVGSIYILGG